MSADLLTRLKISMENERESYLRDLSRDCHARIMALELERDEAKRQIAKVRAWALMPTHVAAIGFQRIGQQHDNECKQTVLALLDVPVSTEESVLCERCARFAAAMDRLSASIEPLKEEIASGGASTEEPRA